MKPDFQAEWPKALIAEGLDLQRAFVTIQTRQPLKTQLKNWFLSDRSTRSMGLTHDDVGVIVPATILDSFCSKYNVEPEQSREAVRQVVLRVFNLLSTNGELPEKEDVASAERLIKEDRLPNLFPPSETPGNLSDL